MVRILKPIKEVSYQIIDKEKFSRLISEGYSVMDATAHSILAFFSESFSKHELNHVKYYPDPDKSYITLSCEELINNLDSADPRIKDHLIDQLQITPKSSDEWYCRSLFHAIYIVYIGTRSYNDHFFEQWYSRNIMILGDTISDFPNGDDRINHLELSGFLP